MQPTAPLLFKRIHGICYVTSLILLISSVLVLSAHRSARYFHGKLVFAFHMWAKSCSVCPSGRLSLGICSAPGPLMESYLCVNPYLSPFAPQSHMLLARDVSLLGIILPLGKDLAKAFINYAVL